MNGQAAGTRIKHVPIWITEMGTYSGTLNKGGRPDPATFQSEDAQARDVVKRYVYSLSLGVKKIFMAFGLVEGFKGGDGYFDHTGFIYDGVGNDDRGSGVKKKAYYAYKVMTSKLEGSDWNSVESVDLGKEDTYAFKFLRNGKPVYVVWWDNYEDELALIKEKMRQSQEEQKQRGLITVEAVLGAIAAFTGTYLILKKVQHRQRKTLKAVAVSSR